MKLIELLDRANPKVLCVIELGLIAYIGSMLLSDSSILFIP